MTLNRYKFKFSLNFPLLCIFWEATTANLIDSTVSDGILRTENTFQRVGLQITLILQGVTPLYELPYTPKLSRAYLCVSYSFLIFKTYFVLLIRNLGYI